MNTISSNKGLTTPLPLISLGLLLFALLLSGCGTTGGVPVNALYTLDKAQSGSTALAVSPDSRLLAVGGRSGRITIRNLITSEQVITFPTDGGEVIGLAFVDDHKLVSAGWGGGVSQWTIGGEQLWRGEIKAGISSMSLSQSLNRMATGSLDGEITLWDLDSGAVVDRWQAHKGRIRALAYAIGAPFLASSDTHRAVKLWDSRNGEPLWQSHSPTDSRDLEFSSDGQWLYGGGWFDLYRWSLPTGELTIIKTEHNGIINGLKFLAKSGVMASVGRQTDSAVLIIDPASGQTLKNLGSHGLCGVNVSVSPDEKYLISNSDDYSISVWKID